MQMSLASSQHKKAESLFSDTKAATEAMASYAAHPNAWDEEIVAFFTRVNLYRLDSWLSLVPRVYHLQSLVRIFATIQLSI